MKSQEREWDLSRLVYLYDQKKDFGELVKFVDSIHDKARLQTLHEVREMLPKEWDELEDWGEPKNHERIGHNKVLSEIKSLLDSQIKELGEV